MKSDRSKAPIRLQDFLRQTYLAQFTKEQMSKAATTAMLSGSISPEAPVYHRTYKRLAEFVGIEYGIHSTNSNDIFDTLQKRNEMSILKSEDAKFTYWEFIDYLVEIDHTSRFDIMVQQAAKISSDTVEGIQTRESYYTAGRPDALSLDTTANSMNHTMTYVISGSNVLNEYVGALLVRSGNSLFGITPVIRAIDERGISGKCDAFRTHGLEDELLKLVDARLKLSQNYRGRH